MSAPIPSFRRNAVRPIECLQSGWNLVKGQYWLFVGICAIGLLLASAVPLGILLGPMMCGIYFCLLDRARGETVRFDMLFKGFDFFMESFVATLFHVIPMIVIIVPIYIGSIVVGVGMGVMSANTSRSDAGFPLMLFALFGAAFVFIMVLAMALAVLFIFTYALIVDRKLSGFNAVKTSIRAAMGNAGGVVGLILLNGLLGLIGALFCYVGAFLVLPITFAGVIVAYQKVFPREGAE